MIAKKIVGVGSESVGVVFCTTFLLPLAINQVIPSDQPSDRKIENIIANPIFNIQ
jgi:hypothetical protein